MTDLEITSNNLRIADNNQDALAKFALSEERLRRSQQFAKIGNWEWGIQNDLVYLCGRTAEMFGFKPHEMVISHEIFLSMARPEDRRLLKDALQNCIDFGRDMDIDYRIFWHEDSDRWIQLSAGVIFDTQGKPERILGIAQDITLPKLTERSLMESEQKYYAVMENSSDAILLSTMNGRIFDANRSAEILFGYKREELFRLHASALHPASEQNKLSAAFFDVNLKNFALNDQLVLRKDGSIVAVEVAATAINYMGEKVALGMFRDITKRKQDEEALLAQQKVYRNTLIREVHHRIKNNLQGVVGLLRQHAARNTDLRVPLESAISQINAIAVVHGLFGNKDHAKIILCEMARATCIAACGVSSNAIAPDIIVDVKKPVHLLDDEAVPVALILNELICNAVKHQSDHLQPIRVYIRDEPGSVVISIITPDTQLPHGFDFSTGQGLGTGLRLVKSLMPNPGCQLSIRNEAMDVTAELRISSPIIQNF